MTTTWSGEPYYSVGLTEFEMSLLIRCIDEEDLSSNEEIELEGIRKKLNHKRKMLRQRERREAS